MNQFLTKRVIKTTLDATSGVIIASHNLGAVIPSGAIITSAFIDVRTTFTSATDAATIALTVEGAGDLVAAIAISDGSNVWDSGRRGTLAGSAALSVFHASNNPTAIQMADSIADSFIKTTADRQVVATVAVEALTAGVLDLYIEYVI